MALFKIIHGDCLEVMRGLEAGSADLIFADPPYWMRTGGTLKRVEGTDYAGCDDAWDNSFTSLADYAAFTRAWLGAARRLLKKNGCLWVIGSMQCIYTIGNALQELGFWLINDVIWWKTNPTPNMLGKRLCNAHETLIWAVRDEKAKFTFHYRTGKELNRDTVPDPEFLAGTRKQLGSVWRFPVCCGNERLKDARGAKLHSTQKPYALLHRIINLCSNRDDLVLDPFAGTCTTGAAALDSGRNFIGIESNAEYCEHGQKRLAKCIDRNGPVENAVYDIRPPRMTVPDMIARGFLRRGEKFFIKPGEGDAILLPDGKLRFPDGSVRDIHSGAAQAKQSRAERLNGFGVWHVRRGERLVGLDEIREKARAHELALVETAGAK